MKKVKFKPEATIILNHPASIEVNGYMDSDGTLYVPMMKVPGAGSAAPDTETADEAEEAAPTRKKPAAKRGTSKADEPEAKSKDLDVGQLVKDLDTQKIVESEFMDAIGEHVKDKAILKEVAAVVNDFMEDDTIEAKNLLADIQDILVGEEEEAPVRGRGAAKKAAAPAKKAPGRGKKPVDEEEEEESEFVEIEDLKLDDEVEVFWKSHAKDKKTKGWFNGVVVKVGKKGDVLVRYEDDDEEILDPAEHTKIRVVPKV